MMVYHTVLPLLDGALFRPHVTVADSALIRVWLRLNVYLVPLLSVSISGLITQLPRLVHYSVLANQG